MYSFREFFNNAEVLFAFVFVTPELACRLEEDLFPNSVSSVVAISGDSSVK
jgi:hypothetical protein